MRDNPDSAGHNKLYEFVASENNPEILRKEIGQFRSFDCMAYCLLGVEALAADNREEAKESYKACVATDYFNSSLSAQATTSSSLE